MRLISAHGSQFNDDVMDQYGQIEPESPDEAKDAEASLKAYNSSDVQRHSLVDDVHYNVAKSKGMLPNPDKLEFHSLLG